MTTPSAPLALEVGCKVTIGDNVDRWTVRHLGPAGGVGITMHLKTPAGGLVNAGCNIFVPARDLRVVEAAPEGERDRTRRQDQAARLRALADEIEGNATA